MDGVVDRIQAVLLGDDSQVELALGCAELAVRKSVRSGHFLRQTPTSPYFSAIGKTRQMMPHCGIKDNLSMVVDATKMPHLGRTYYG